MRKDVKRIVEEIKLMGIKPNMSELARKLNCDSRTVKKYLEGEETKKEKNPRKKKTTKLDGYKEIIEDKVEKYSATAKSIFEFIKERGFEGEYGIVKKYVREIKSQNKKKATMRFETMPGFQAQVDWKENFKLISKTGEKYIINIFLYILGYSRIKYIKLTFDRKQSTLLKCLDNAFEYTGGVPKEILFDNMRTVADINEKTFGEAKINEKFNQFSKDYMFIPLLCRPYRPQTKGKVEVLAKLMGWLKPYNEEFKNEEELIEIVKRINEKLNTKEVCQAFDDIPLNRLDKEKEYLNPLPNSTIRSNYLTHPKEYKVTKESIVKYKGNKYSVPINYIGKKVNLKASQNTLAVYYNTEKIETHVIKESHLNYKKDTLVEILQSDSMKDSSTEDINKFIENRLKQMDMIIE